MGAYINNMANDRIVESESIFIQGRQELLKGGIYIIFFNSEHAYYVSGPDIWFLALCLRNLVYYIKKNEKQQGS